MDDLISRQDAIETINETIAQYIPYLIRETNGIPLEMVLAIKRLPFTQPERKIGIYTESREDDEWYCRYATCNECGKTWMGSRNFCPNCGTIMKGNEE